MRRSLDVDLPEGVHKVEIRASGKERINVPIGQTWDRSYRGGTTVSGDFRPKREAR